jgi:predicted esterase
MKLTPAFLAVVVVAVPLAVSPGQQQYAPPPSNKPDRDTLQAIADKTAKLGKVLASLRQQGVRDPLLADVEVYHKAAVWIVRHDEFFQPDFAAWTLEALDRGLLRARQLAEGESPWLQSTGRAVVRGYRSRIDGSVQPYAITFPADYGKDPRKKWRLDVVLHGRDTSLTEVKFLHQHAGDRPAPEGQPFVELDIYGRGNNAYRWAGETDVFEAINAFTGVERMLGRDGLLDPSRVVLRGFSMGGAGSWHIGLHHPDRWAVIGPGAGFTTTHGYIAKLPDKLPPYQEATLHIYDAVDYAENAFDVPVVAYGGDQDPQLQAARNIEERLRPLKIPMTLLVAPGLAHRFPPEWQKKAEAEYARFAGPGQGRKEYPERVRFVTYTLKYPTCDWVEVLGLDRHYERSLVDATKTEAGFTVQTANVRALRLGLLPEAVMPLVVRIDGQDVSARPSPAGQGRADVYLERKAGRWGAVLPQRLLTDRQRHVQKVSGLQGPIDDAFIDSFLCVRGTGQPWHDSAQRYADAALKRFRDEWNKYLRGDLPVKDDADVTAEDIVGRHLVLFGDPSSNSLIAQVIDALPLAWTKDRLTLAGHSYPAAGHVPALIYPSPLNPTRYVVLNTGHTFHAPDFRGTNALLYPRLGDYAVLKPTPTEKDPADAEVMTAGLFDEHWRVGKE